ncbi:MAG: hypothetical protein ACPGWS_08995 [Solirubrobacterales bacterium]
MEPTTTHAWLIEMERPDAANLFWCGGKQGVTWGGAVLAVRMGQRADAEAVVKVLKRQPEFASMGLKVAEHQLG